MNTHADYRRHAYRPEPPNAPGAAPAEVEISRLAHHRDPSLAPGSTSTATSTPAAAAQRIAWVRPTELATYAAPMVGRGVDLQAELVRRARRTPATAARSIHPPAPAEPTQTRTPGQNGFGL